MTKPRHTEPHKPSTPPSVSPPPSTVLRGHTTMHTSPSGQYGGLIVAIIATAVAMFAVGGFVMTSMSQIGQWTEGLTNTREHKPTKQISPSTQTTCVVPEDLDGTLMTMDPSMLNAISQWNDHIFFEPDSTEYSFGEIMEETYEDYALFYDTVSHKQFTFQITGSLHKDAPKNLVDARIAIVKEALIDHGIPADVIAVGEPLSIPDDYVDASSHNVVITIKNTGECAS